MKGLSSRFGSDALRLEYHFWLDFRIECRCEESSSLPSSTVFSACDWNCKDSVCSDDSLFAGTLSSSSAGELMTILRYKGQLMKTYIGDV